MFPRHQGSASTPTAFSPTRTWLVTARRCAFAAAIIAAFSVAAAAQTPATPQGGTQGNESQTGGTQTGSPSTASQQQQNALPAQAPSGGAGVDAEHYVIGPEDGLQITVWKEPTLSGSIPVRPDGMISMVLVGDIKAAGRTPMQLAGDITERLKKYIQDPNVSVLVMGVGSQKIFMVGEVGHVGPIPLGAGMTGLQAIAAAGGLSPYANAKKIYILRTEGGKQQKIPFDYKKALKGEALGPELKPGDTIVVP